MDVVKEKLNVAGLLTNVYARSGLRDNHASEPVVVLFFLHGRGVSMSAEKVYSIARATFARVAEKQASSKQEPRDFMVVTFDQRNHGTRMVDKRGNLAYSRKAEKHNERNAVDMYGTLMGAVKDVSFLVDVLPSYIFPNDERTIDEWVLAGFSFGGHATWLGLRHEPRIRIGIPICGCPDYLTLVEQRAERLGVPRVPPYIPGSLRALVRSYDTVAAPAGTFAGKSVLVLAGADDTVVPWATCRAFVETLDVERGRKEILIVPGVKHELTDGMKEEMFRFFWDEALVGEVGVRQRSAL